MRRTDAPKADVKQVARALGLKVGASTMKCPDPAHDDKHPSCSVGRSSWRCCSCGAGGDAVAMVRLVLGLSYLDACQWVAERTGGHLPPPEPARDLSTPPVVDALDAIALTDLWQVVRSIPPESRLMRAWAAERGLDAEAMYRAGVRDWSLARRRIFEVLEAHRGRHVSLGFAGEAPDGRVLPWLPLRRRWDDSQAARMTAVPGLAVPVWLPGVAVPAGYRWRCIPAYAPKSGGSVKCLAMRGGPGREGALVFGPPLSSQVIVVEGEPDFLAWCGWLQHSPARVVGITGTWWRGHWARFLEEAQLVVYACHDVPTDDPKKAKAKQAKDELLARVRDAARAAGAQFKSHRVPESEDWADRAKTGWRPWEPWPKEVQHVAAV